MRKALKIFARVLLGLFVLILLLWGVLQTPWGQKQLAQMVTSRLSRDLQTKVTIREVNFNLFTFNKMNLHGVLVEDQKQDTLLYAGLFQVRITDWFFFRDKAELKYVGLQDASIHLNRTDSVWNYQFLLPYFSSSKSSSGKKKAGIEFDLKKVELRNVRFFKKDAWIGNDLTVRVGGMDMDARKITLSDKTIDISNVTLTDPYFSLFDYKGNKVESEDAVAVAKAIENETGLPWKIKFDKVSIVNGRFRNDRGTMETKLSYFDGQHVDFSKINGTLEDIGWTGDSVTGRIDLTTVERSGFTVKSLKAKTTFHPKGMIFENLDLQTNRSTIRDYFAMRYDNIGSLSDFMHEVAMEAHFKNSSVSSDDIAFFAPEIRNWKKNIRIDGEVRGTVDGLSSKDLEIWAGNNTYIHGSVSLVGLPNINETLINIEAEDLRTTYRDAVHFIPAIRNITTPNLSRLTQFRFQGSYTGFINNFVTYGNIQTNLGNLQTDLNMKFPPKGEPSYEGTLSTAGFQMGAFMNSQKVGIVDFTGKVKGRGFQWQTLDMDIDGHIRRIQYEDYTYRNIRAKGNFNNRMFLGDFEIKDPNADLSLHGLVDLRGKVPLFKVNADIIHADLQALQLTKRDLKLSGKFELDLQASSLSDILGNARIYNASLVHNGKPLSFDSLVVSSHYIDGMKSLRAISNEFDATLTGDFDMAGLPNAFTLFLSRYYPSYIDAPVKVIPQVFTFDITTGEVEDYIDLVDPRLSGFNDSRITGSLNTSTNTMTVDADVPYFSFNQYSFSDVRLKGNGDLEQLSLIGEVTNAQIGDSLFFPQTQFSIEARNDVSDITIVTSSNLAINQASLSAQIRTYNDGATVLFNPSSFVLNGKTWSLEQGGELNFRRNTIVQGGVTFRESNQEIRLWTQPDDVGDWNNLHVAFRNVNIGDFTPFITRAYRIEGLLNGEAIVIDPQKRMDVTSDIRLSELRFDNDSIGMVGGKFYYNNKTGLLTGKANNVDPVHKVEMDLAMNLRDSLNVFQDRVNLRFTQFDLKYLNHFLGGIFSDINGYVTGNFDITGEGASRAYTAKARLTDASLKVNFTQVSYTIDDTEFEMRKDTIDLNGLRLRDRFGNTAKITGFISHKAFSNMYYDIAVQSESPQLELMNTTYNDNQTFYGRAMGSGLFVLVGPQHSMLMNIDIKASETDSSHIVLPPSRTRESGQANFMVERKYGREMTPQSMSLGTSLNYDIHLAANPLVNVEVILDELTGDRIRGKGNGNLQITSGTSEPLTLTGRYNINEGDYIFTFQSFLKKNFVLRKNANNYIEWNGDPYDAKVHLEAVYTAEEVSFAPLANTLFSGSGSYTGLRDDVNVVATLTGDLFRPRFDFKLEFPSNNVVYSQPDFTFALQQIEKNQNEMNKQVTYLIVFNSFAPFENTTAVGFDPFGEFTYNTISGLLFGKVNEQLNRILSKILQNNNATLNFTGSLYNRNLVDPNSKSVFRLPNQTNVNLSLGVPLFNDRAHITIGATVDVPIVSDFEQTVRLFPDVTLELLINKSGSVRATFFYRQNVDFLTGNAPGGIVPRRYGASIGYGKEFNTIGELFGRQKKNGPPLPLKKPVTDLGGTN